MSKLAGATLSGIAIIAILGAAYLIYKHHVLPPPSDDTVSVDLIKSSALECSADPLMRRVRENGTVTFHVRQGHSYKIKFSTETPFTTGGMEPVIHEGDVFVAAVIPAAVTSKKFLYEPEGEGDCKSIVHDIGIIVSH